MKSSNDLSIKFMQLDNLLLPSLQRMNFSTEVMTSQVKLGIPAVKEER